MMTTYDDNICVCICTWTYQKNDLIIKSSYGLILSYFLYNSFKDYSSIKSEYEESKYYKFEEKQPLLNQKIDPEEIDVLIQNYNRLIYDNLQSKWINLIIIPVFYFLK